MKKEQPPGVDMVDMNKNNRLSFLATGVVGGVGYHEKLRWCISKRGPRLQE